jgi:putative ABC transport system permease protein
MALIRRIRNLLHRTDVNREIDEELRAHIDLRTEENIARGMSPEEAKREALLRFGNPASTREQVAAADATLGLERVWADLRYAVRQLLKSPGFSITAILSLSIGIGANTAIFSSMDAVVLRPLAVPAMDRILTIVERQDSGGGDGVAYANYEDWIRQSRSFEELSIRTSSDMSLTGTGDAAHVQVERASANFFSALRVQPILGRLYADGDCRPGRDSMAVLNYGFWQRRFAGDPKVVGRTIELDQRAYTVIGVLPKSVQYPPEAEIFLPLALTPQQLADRSNRGYHVEGRLRDGMTVPQAQADLRAIAAQLAAIYPNTNRAWTVRAEPLLNTINGDLTPLYYRLIMGATLFVLLVVCANVANLQFARGIERRTEIAMRTALGASRSRILRQLLTENMLLGFIGAGGGLILGWLYLRLTLVFMPERVARHMSGWSNISLNGHAFVLSLALALLAGLVSGIAPALDALRTNLSDQLKSGSRSTIGSGPRRWLRNLFAVAQISFAVALVIGAALMAKGMNAQFHIADAYGPEKILTFSIALPDARYDMQKQAAWYSDSLAKLRALPGVTHAEVTNVLPYTDYGWNREFQIDSRPAALGHDQNALQVIVSSGYLSAFHIPILDGRGFNAGDSLHSTPVAIVSRRFVDQYFAGQNPIGHRIHMGTAETKDAHNPWLTIVGIADEAKYTLWDQNAYSVVYVSSAQLPSPTATYAVMTSGDPLALAEPARKALAAIDPTLPLDSLLTYRRLLNDSLIGLMYAAGMIAFDALIALFLAAIGIFGVMANLVGERTREIGVRLAMGARREDVLRMILGRASRLTAIGVGVGLIMAFSLARLVANLLIGVRPDDPLVFVGITVTIAAIALAASWIPARRAARVDPMHALRAE